MLEQIFLKVIDMSWEASIVIGIVFIVRILLKRFPKYLSYMLWSVVLFRLLCPVTLEFEISFIPQLEPAFYEYATEKDVVPTEVLDELAGLNTGNAKSMSETGQAAQSYQDEPAEPAEVSGQELFILLGKYVWISGMGILFLYSVVSAVKIRNKVLVSIPFKENIYITDETASPFVMGLLSPKIYLPGYLSEKEQEYIILHEKFHIRRFDHVVKPVAFAALCIHWFNPLVWAAFVFFCKDMEMSCDEAVIKKMGENIRADYSASLLALSTQHRVIRGIPVDFGEGDTKGRVKNLAAFRKTPKVVLAILIAGVVILIVFLTSNRKPLIADSNNPEDEMETTENQEIPDTHDEPERLNLSLNIAEHYITNKGDPSNLYYIDENNVLWGSGRNEYGQLGQGTQDYEFYSETVKIAENVVHVDYSQKGFVIFLTNDHKLYGMGNAGCGALQQYEEFDWTRYTNGENYTVTTPILLMENVVYARCGRDDIVCLEEDGTVWTWGTIYIAGGYLSNNVYFIEKPEKILENAVLVTGGWFNHAALLQDGTVWTWGDNRAGNCGVADLAVVSEPTMVAEDVVMVWSDLAVAGYPNPNADEIAMAWTGAQKDNAEYDNIAELGEFYPKFLNNTVIRKADGSYWACGENVGTEEKVVHGAEGAYSIICTHEFYPCEYHKPKTLDESTPKDNANWEKEYKNIICNIENNLTDPYSLRNDLSLYVYIGVHDFDNDGIPELVIGDGISAAVFTYQEGQAQKIADLYEPESWAAINGLHFKNNTIILVSNGSDGSGYVCFTYDNGDYITGTYDDYNQDKAVMNEKLVTGEEFEACFDLEELLENSRVEYILKKVETEVFLEIDGESVAVKDLNFNLIMW